MEIYEEVTIEILAGDILTTDYCDSHTCAITRAFERQKLPIRHVGMSRVVAGGDIVVGMIKDKEEHTKLRRMYAHKSTEFSRRAWNQPDPTKSITPENFSMTFLIKKEFLTKHKDGRE
jgi:hypothetical protein